MLSRQFICNQTSYDHNFWYACVKKCYNTCAFLFFENFEGWLLLSVKMY